jgi:TnpA family transposase
MESLLSDGSTESDSFSRMTAHSIMGSFKRTRCLGQASTRGLMAESTRGSFTATTCRASAAISGKMGESMKASKKITRSMDSVSITGQMADAMRVTGGMANSTALVPSKSMERLKNMASGRMARTSNGSTRRTFLTSTC